MSRSKPQQHAATFGGTPDDVEAAFYESLRSGYVDQLMVCWADEDDIACIHPGGARLLGSAVHHVLERVEVMTPQGAAQAIVMATNVYHKTAQGWRLVVHHASPGTAGAAQELPQASQVLH
jgi:SnoaL-like domain